HENAQKGGREPVAERWGLCFVEKPGGRSVRSAAIYRDEGPPRPEKSGRYVWGRSGLRQSEGLRHETGLRRLMTGRRSVLKSDEGTEQSRVLRRGPFRGFLCFLWLLRRLEQGFGRACSRQGGQLLPGERLLEGAGQQPAAVR